ncbi:uncharacterized protein LOC110441160 isoform X2 [Mizuhopecten yessoensis]|uniref:uncharacterized protein LOC110441160 isoform X2 n=1 Tax=Mizuhopecten yessoensis TaxID=6573 RepID=UPI000B45BE8A|nr:uncharacterized protein LOC110441160 isoform X2 [Mizuhopecten yessoensis]
MASNLSTEVRILHNKMVFDISREIFGEQLEEVKELFSNNPLSSVDISKITNIRQLFQRLMNYETIGYGKYQRFVSKISCIHPQVCSIVQKCAEEINKLQGNPDDQDDDEHRIFKESLQSSSATASSNYQRKRYL